jgi:hypothetical protein
MHKVTNIVKISIYSLIIKQKIESDFSAHKLRATYDTDDVTEIFDENIFHAKDETEMDHLQQEEENDAK